MASSASAARRGPTKTLQPRRDIRSGSSPATSTLASGVTSSGSRDRLPYPRLNTAGVPPPVARPPRSPAVPPAQYGGLPAALGQPPRQLERDGRLPRSAHGEIADRDH